MEKIREFDIIPTHHLIKAVYDSIYWTGLFRLMLEFGIPKKLANLSKMAMNKISCSIMVENETPDTFTTNTGLIHGDADMSTIQHHSGKGCLGCWNTRGTIFNKSIQFLA